MLHWLKKSLLLIVLIGVYFLGLREIRKIGHNALMGSLLPDNYGEITDGLFFFSQSSVSFTLAESMEADHGWQYKMPFGSFFLFSILGLVFVGGKSSDYGVLALIHVTGFVLSTLFVWIGLRAGNGFFVVPDMLSRYLVPLASLGLVALVYLRQKNTFLHEE
ncbi:MAG TPA: hypothetical protein DEQ34_14065 [Balneolaceae bacterium]|nr:hypothetical protein [Balneolaceae bacterium]|tara:strand:+ start:4585 stop:5070 length:486 start_codon:yes stop_codon:yes gene_type:complete